MKQKNNKKIAIVTGGSSGMGLAIAKKLRDEGIHVYIFDIQEPPEKFDYFHVDIRNDEEIKNAISCIPRIDILINNAGIYFEKYIEDTSNDEINRMVDINIKGTYMVTRNAMDKIKQAKGCIITIASCLGMVPELTSPLYCTTKAGSYYVNKMSCSTIC